MKKQYQVTIFCTTGQYKPLSCVLTREEVNLDDKAARLDLMTRGVEKICASRYMTKFDLKKNNYTAIKVREYNKAELDREAAARYEAIKEAHYADGTWKRPKKSLTSNTP